MRFFKITRVLSAVLAMVFLFVNSPVSAIGFTNDDRNSIIGQTPFYDPNSTTCGTTANINSDLPAAIPEPYKTLLTNAAASYQINPQFLAALFLNENGNVWKPFDTKWASSPAGASGPFQFMPGTWAAYKVDGDNNGTTDINDITDAAFGAANLLSKNGAALDTPLGDLNVPFIPGTFLYISAIYNWGGGNVQVHTKASSPLSAAPTETQNYLKNSYVLITSGFTKAGNPNYGDPRSSVGDASPASTSTAQPGTGCSSGIVAGNIVQTALNLAWDSSGHGKQKSDAKDTYQTTMPTANGSKGSDEWSDCGVFVSTVMVASGADPSYPKRGTLTQIPYLKAHADKYEEFDNFTNTSQLQPGDIFINSQHTYMYVGPQKDGYNSVSASLHGHVPQASNAYFDQEGEHFIVFRIKSGA